MVKNDNRFEEVLSGKGHRTTVYGFHPEKGNIFGFCNKCHTVHRMKDVFNDIEAAGNKTMYVGKCPACKQVWEIIDIKLSKKMIEEERKVDREIAEKLRLQQAAEKIRVEKVEAAQGWRRNRKTRDGATTKEKRDRALMRLKGLRKYYSNLVRNVFASQVNDFDANVNGGEYFCGETAYYEGAIKVCIREILTTGINSIWWMKLGEAEEFMTKNQHNLELGIETTRRMQKMIELYEKLNWDKYFSDIAIVRRKNGEAGCLDIEYPLDDMREWIEMNKNAIYDIRHKAIVCDEEDDFDDVIEDDDKGDNVTRECRKCDTNVTVNAWEYQREKDEIREEYDKGLDDLEYGIDEIPDV